MCAIETENSVHGFDAIVAESLMREYKGGAFDPCETKGGGETCWTSTEDEGIVDFAKHGLSSLFFMFDDQTGAVAGGR